MKAAQDIHSDDHWLLTDGVAAIGPVSFDSVRRFVAEGATVVFADRDVERGKRVAAEIEAGGGQALFVEAHMEREAEAAAFVRQAADRFGRLDVLVNNAGINVRGDFRHLSDADWARIREVNLDGVVRVARDGFALLKASGRGSLINVASIMAHRGLRQLTAYSATKGAVVALTRGLAVEYAPFGIRVNALCPGFVHTALTERVLRNPAIEKALVESTALRRLGQPEEVARAALFLAGDEASYVTGAELAVDGGMSAAL